DREALDALQFSPGGRPDEVEGALLQTRLLARQGRGKATPRYVRVLLGQPEHRGAAAAAMGEGIRERSGPSTAADARRAVKLALADPANADALAEFVELLAASGKSREAIALPDAGLKSHPDAAQFHAVKGRALVLSGAPAAAARASFERA